MNYQKLYDKIIDKAKQREHTIGENHHILPKCLGGDNSKNNLVLLTYREHFICHWILTKIHPTHSGINYAFLCMIRNPGYRVINSRFYDIVKRNFSKFKKWHTKLVNPGRSQKSREMARQRMLTANPMKLNPEKNPFLGTSFVKGRKWYNNGITNLYLYETDVVPEGFVAGMKSYKRIRNGKDSSH